MEKSILIQTAKAAILTLALTTATLGCSKKDEETQIADFVLVSGTLTDQGASRIEGTGVLRFRDTLDIPTRHYAFSIRGGLNPGNTALEVIGNATSHLLDDGIHVRFERHGLEVRILLTRSGSPTLTVNQDRLGQLIPNALGLIVEFHNDAEGVRVLVWRQESPVKNAVTAVFDTDNADHIPSVWTAPTGEGIFMGLKLENAEIKQATLIEATLKN